MLFKIAMITLGQARLKIGLLVFICITSLTGCISPTKIKDDNGQLYIELPLRPGWYEGELVYYISTDASDLAFSKKMGLNYTPRLKDALPPRPKPPGLKTALERIYVFINGEQPSILPSIPEPLGPDSQNLQYSPLWLFYEVYWQEGIKPYEIKDEESLFKAEDKSHVRIVATDLIVNCPIVATADQSLLGAKRSKNKKSSLLY